MEGKKVSFNIPKGSELKSTRHSRPEANQLDLLRGDATVIPNKIEEVEKKPDKMKVVKGMWAKTWDGIKSLNDRVEIDESFDRIRKFSEPVLFRTDRGTLISGMHWDSEASKKEEFRGPWPAGEDMSSFKLQKVIEEKYGAKVKIKEPANEFSQFFNGHAYVFLDVKHDKVALSSKSVATILKDDYYPIATHKDLGVSHEYLEDGYAYLKIGKKKLRLPLPEPGDVMAIIYHKSDVYSGAKDINQSGVFRFNGEVTSKWGLGPVVEHAIINVPPEYGEKWTIFRANLPNGRRMSSVDKS